MDHPVAGAEMTRIVTRMPAGRKARRDLMLQAKKAAPVRCGD
jgi:hypothetical protein